jgi:hypothetical protein
MGNINSLPYEEIIEKVTKLARDDAENSLPKIRGVIQNLYLREIPRKFDWSFLLSSTSLALNGEYKTGTVSATTGSNALVFNGATLTAGMVGRKIKVGNGDGVFDIQTVSGTSDATITPNYYGISNVSGGAYSIFDPDYALPKDFDRFPKGGGLKLYQGGMVVPLVEEAIQEYYENYNASPSVPEACHIEGVDTNGRNVVVIRPAPDKDISLGCDYIKKLTPMKTTSSGLLGWINSATTIVVGDSNTKFTEATTGDYLRVTNLGIGEDSEWYRIATITNSSTMTLSTAFALTGVTSANYCISSAPEYPEKMHDALIWGALRTLVGDAGDQMFAFYNNQLAEVLSDGKRLYVTRQPSTTVHSIALDYNYRR